MLKLTELITDLHTALHKGVEELDDATDVVGVFTDGVKLTIETIDGKFHDLTLGPARDTYEVSKSVDLSKFNPDDTTREDL